MKVGIVIAALLANLATLGAASAADLSRPITKAPPLPPLPVAYNWTGFYLGVNVGGSWGHQDVTLAGLLINSNKIDGVIGGGQIGYNWQGAGSPWVFGIEADIQGSGQKGSGAFAIPACLTCALAIPATSIAYEDKLEWFGTVRGRIGYAIGDRGTWLPYITGGLAYGESKIDGSGSLVGVPVAFSVSDTRVGWTVGAGIEWAFADQWSAKLEYLFMDLGSDPAVVLTSTTSITTNRMTDNIARVGVNLRF
jgi:outer membrane immunogenic protein